MMVLGTCQQKIINLFIILSVISNLSFGDHTLTNDTIFVPTNEWQTVKPGQQLPPSLHVRHDFETGITEAKLMDPQERTNENFPAVISNVTETDETPKLVNISASDGLDSERLQLSHIEEELDESYVQSIKSKFRSYDELKADFQKIKAEVKTDFEILEGIMKSLIDPDISDDRLPFLLEDLSYLLHQVDNGRLFAEKDGFTLLRRFIVHRNIAVQKLVLSSMSAAIQGNADVKVAALQNGLLDVLCLKMRDATGSARPVGESVTLLASTLTTLGVLLRDFPSAQKYFFSTDPTVQPLVAGFELLTRVFDYKVEEKELQNKISQLRVRLLSLISDLVLERTDAKQRLSSTADEKTKRLVKMYSETEFEHSLTNSGWCDRLYSSLLHDMPHGVTSDHLDAVSNHGSRQQLLSAMLNLHPFCEDSLLKNPGIRPILRELEQEYTARLALPENTDDLFFKDMLNLVIQVRSLADRVLASRRMTDEF